MFILGYIHGIVSKLYFCNSPPFEMIVQYLILKGVM